MRNRLLAATIAAVLFTAPLGVASSQARFSVSGGVAAPMSDLGDEADLGYHVAAGLNFGGAYLPIGARIEGSLSQFSLKNFNDDVRILNATANAVVNIGQGSNNPYLIGGLGIYNSKFGNADARNAVGANLGGGLRFPIGGLNAFFEARYHAMLGERGAGANLQYIPITLGIVF
jgi:Outer membrane protein beta-barrel domain